MVILAGGVGRRMKESAPKQFSLLGGKPVIMHTLDRVAKFDDIDDVVITCPPDHLADTRTLLENHALERDFRCIEGGETRQESVYRGLLALSEHETVIIHEAVRPFVTAPEFRAIIDCEHPNAIYGTRIPFTVLRGGETVEGTLERQQLVNVQLPQKFRTAPLLQAHEMARERGLVSTEDASLLFDMLGEAIAILPGSDRNIKITVPEDLIAAEALYEEYVLVRDRS
jgi:2-C-methyl-D-erythritol 4-phosphate cytidylyltransferase